VDERNAAMIKMPATITATLTRTTTEHRQPVGSGGVPASSMYPMIIHHPARPAGIVIGGVESRVADDLWRRRAAIALHNLLERSLLRLGDSQQTLNCGPKVVDGRQDLPEGAGAGPGAVYGGGGGE
jgi:hypothetical protein